MRGLEAEGFVEADGARLEYRWIAPRRAGLPTLVLLHEGLGCVAVWKDFPDRLAESTGCGAFVYSRRGYGRSSPVPLPRPLTYLHHEARVVLPQLLAQLGLRDVVLVGHSDGASIALIHAGSAHSGPVRGVIVEAPHVFNEDLSVAGIRRTVEAYATGDLRTRLERLHGGNVDGAFLGWSGAWLDPGYRSWNIEEVLPAIRVPVLVIQGVDDEYGTAAQYEAIRAQASGPVEVLALERCRHTPHRDQAEAVLAAMTGFVLALRRS
ncbi:alpha/beta fold hydrolase [Arenibaculum pallidiluteum]|uniref:alpha/beta fold hydrolase n=1 Tax=Arenibaculum pallidiluteum TaxID=2812559 RepID=UPI001A95A73E|nr:alpha/beta hydrolase [Arenibaculum pallidiluteum]